MPTPYERACLLLAKAREDLIAVQALINNPEIAKEIIGFHAQQAVEKALKAILTFKGIAFRKTHDIAELIDLLHDNKLPVPGDIEQAVELTPFAVEFRYDFIPPETEEDATFHPRQIENAVEATLRWAQSIVRAN